MRSAFIRVITKLAHEDKNLYLINADTGFRVFDEFKNIFPERYLNIGISESAMIGVASGLALSGKNVFVYAIVPFVTMRCFEQIRNDLCFQKLPVKLIGIGGGLTYGGEGASHHSIEDIAVMNSLPNMTVVCPGDPIETEKAIEDSVRLEGPVYVRLGKSGEKIIHAQGIRQFRIGEGIIVKEGEDLAIISTGNMLETASDVYRELINKGMSPRLISMHTIKPIDRRLIIDTAQKCRFIVTIEEHSVIGGLGSRVAEVVTEEDLRVRLFKFALPDRYADVVGDHAYLRRYFGLTSDQILEVILSRFTNSQVRVKPQK